MSETNPFQDLANALATAHREVEALKAKLAQSEAKVKELEAKLEVYERDLCCECEGRVELQWVCLDCGAQSEESPREEARKKGAEHGAPATCGEVEWCFNDGGPVENKVIRCRGCGHPVQVKQPQDAAKKEE